MNSKVISLVNLLTLLLTLLTIFPVFIIVGLSAVTVTAVANAVVFNAAICPCNVAICPFNIATPAVTGTIEADWTILANGED